MNFAGFFTLGRVLLWVVTVAGSAWLGWEWSEGRAARAALEELEASVEEINREADRFQDIARDFEGEREQIDEFFTDQDQRFANFVNRYSVLLDACDIGPDGLQLWNEWNRGPERPAAASEP